MKVSSDLFLFLPFSNFENECKKKRKKKGEKSHTKYDAETKNHP